MRRTGSRRTCDQPSPKFLRRKTISPADSEMDSGASACPGYALIASHRSSAAGGAPGVVRAS
eukprot:7270197-Prymnesium_polylepis.1